MMGIDAPEKDVGAGSYLVRPLLSATNLEATLSFEIYAKLGTAVLRPYYPVQTLKATHR